MYDNIIKYHWNLPCMHCINNVHCSSTRVKKMYNVTLLGTACTKQYAQGPKVQSNRREGPALGILREHLRTLSFPNTLQPSWDVVRKSQDVPSRSVVPVLHVALCHETRMVSHLPSTQPSPPRCESHCHRGSVKAGPATKTSSQPTNPRRKLMGDSPGSTKKATLDYYS